MYVANVKGLRTKSHKLYADTSTHVTDIYAFCETNLWKDIASSEYFDSNYNVFRRDRYEGTQSTNTGGGVLTAVSSKFVCDAVPLVTSNNIECLCVKIILNRNSNVYIYNAYIPPSSSAVIYESHFDAIQRVHDMCTQSDIVLVVGDFNINRVEWERDYDDVNDDYSNVMLPNFAHLEDRLRHTSEFILNVNSLGLYQINNVWRDDHRDDNYILPHNILDLVFTNDIENVNVTRANTFLNDEKFHPPVMLSFEWNHQSDEGETSTVLSFKKANYELMNRLLLDSNISNRLKDYTLTLENKVDLLMSTLQDAINQCVPNFVKKTSPKCPWSTAKLRNLKNIQAKASKHKDKRWYNSAKAEFDKLNMQLYGEYMDRIASAALKDTKLFWQHVNIRRKTNASPKLLHYQGTSTANEQIQTELFANFFATNFNSTPNGATIMDGVDKSSCSNKFFELGDLFILEELLRIDTSKGVGPDGIHPLVLKNCASTLSDPLSII